MILINNPEHQELVKQSQASVGVFTNYLEDVLKPALLRADWLELELLDIGFDANGNSLGEISSDRWELADFFHPNDKSKRKALVFTDKKRVIERNLKNELKVLMLTMLWVSPHDYSLGACYKYLNTFKHLTKPILAEQANTFSHLTNELLAEWVQAENTGINFKASIIYDVLNKLVIEKSFLPFDINIEGHLVAKDFNISINESKQKMAIPQRIYSHLLNHCDQEVNRLYSIRDNIQKLSNSLVEHKKKQLQAYAKYIHQKGVIDYLDGASKSNLTFKNAFELLNSPSENEVYQLVKRYVPSVNNNFTNAPSYSTVFENKKITSLREVELILSQCTSTCSVLVIALSGMRTDEFYRLHTINGCDSKVIQGQTIYWLNADLSKIKKGRQARQDTFVTTETGMKAFEVINAIHKPFRESCPVGKRDFIHTYNGGFSSTTKNGLRGNILRWLKAEFGSGLALTTDDIRDLQVSDPSRELGVGDTFIFGLHQLRRSFAYYLIGYELLSFPQLKQQFSHFSFAMTRYYAANTSKFQALLKNKKTLCSEVNQERITQKAELYLKIYERLANNERMAGGKGKSFVEKRLKGDNNLFTERKHNDLLTLAYWEAKLRKGGRHIHVIAPGMYCTSVNCSLRTEVSLIDCVDCENDIIVDTVFAEAKRKEAEEAMHYDILHDELTPQSATECEMKISAAEQIMTDLGIDFEPVTYPQEVSDILIKWETENA